MATALVNNTRGSSRAGHVPPVPPRAGPHGTSPFRRGRAAFSLWELLVVLSVISIVAAMAVPRYASSVGRYRAECAARRVAADLVLAMAKAKAASASRVVTFNQVAGTYTLSGARHLDHSADPYTVNLGAPPYHASIGYASFGGVPQVELDMYGVPKWGGKVIVRAGDFERTVELVRENGSVRVL